MAKKKKKAATTENFYFTVDDWCHEYLYGINRTRNLFPGNVMEINGIRIIGRLRNVTKRKIETGELWLTCMDGVKDRLHDDAEAIGSALVRQRRLECGALVPLIVFHSFPATLAAGKITEFHVTVRNLRYNSGDTDSFSMHRSLSDLAEDGEKGRALPETPARFD